MVTVNPGKLVGAASAAQSPPSASSLSPDRLPAERQIFEATFRSALVGIAQMDIDARFVNVNERFCEITGRSREELIGGLTAYDVTHPDDRGETAHWIATLREGAENFTLEKRYVRPDNSIVWVSKGVSSIRDESGGLRGVVAIVTDINDRKVAEAGIRDSQQRYVDLIHALGVAVYTTDAAGRITYYNEAAVELWGRRPELGVDEWCGSWHLYHTDGTPMAHDECPMAITLKENRPHRGAIAIAERPDGTRVTFMPFPTPLHDGTGNLVGAVNVLVDVTERERAKAEADRQRDLIHTIADNMSVGLLMVDSEGRVEYMNPAAENVTGYHFDDLRGEALHDKVHRMHADGLPFAREDCMLDQANRAMQILEGHEDVFVRPDGSFYNIICNVAPIVRNGRPMGSVIDLRDATEEKRAQEAIRQSMSLKDQFLGLVSHELRTPIATIVGNAILLLRRGDALPQEGKEQALTDIAGESQKLQRIIENLLLITRMEAGKPLEADPVRLPIAVNEAVTIFLRRSPKRTISIVTDGEVPIALGHADMIPLVFDNLITNADKYSPLEAPIEIRIYAGDEGDVRVCVRDYGIGLNPAEAEDVFQPFYRSPRAKTHAAGIGLGLAVCRRVIEAQGGRIWAVIRPEGGCDFIVSLNRAPES